MKYISTSFLLLLLAACSRGPSGTYAAIGKNGEVPRNPTGQPRFTLTFDNGEAIGRVGQETTLLKYKIVDDTLFLTAPNESRAEPFRIKGDLLEGDEMSFKKL